VGERIVAICADDDVLMYGKTNIGCDRRLWQYLILHVGFFMAARFAKR